MTGTADVGVRGSAGGTRGGITGGLFYAPGYVQAEGRGMPAWRSYRAVGGFYLGSWTFGLSWQETGRGADSTLRTLGAYVEAGL